MDFAKDVAIALVSLALGSRAGWWYARRPRKVKQEDRKAGITRYQEHKEKKLNDGR